MNELDDIFKEQSRRIKIILAQEEIDDPYEKNVTLSELPSLPILAIVSDLSFSKASWVMVGITTESAKELLIEKKYKSLIEKCYKIIIDNVIYDGWKINGRMQIKEEGDYLRIFAYIKKES